MSDLNFPNKISDTTMSAAWSEINKDNGLAKSARFLVRIEMPAWTLSTTGATPFPTKYKDFTKDLIYLCEAAEMPGRSFLSVDARYYGPSQKLPFQTQYEDTTMTFLCRSKSMERQFFDDWMENINPTGSFDFNFRSEYETKIHISQFAEYGYPTVAEAGPNRGTEQDPRKAVQETYRITLFNAYPIIINPQPMTWADDQFQRLAVTFTYYKWQRIDYDKKANPQPDTLVSGSTSSGLKTISASQGGGFSGGGTGGGGGSGF